ncbi:MAG: nuclease [Candidatus Marinimicrobia bacterium]|nr:nuclease [Candidatus Neomarinimicrobiota bacterium]|tara:strand:- start:3882 stop:4352 length:471 start_codon:yes stop_codon:yes gene_type:complete
MKTAIFVDVQNIYYTTRDHFGRSFNYRSFWDQIQSEHKIIKANAYAIDKGDQKQQKFQYALKTIGFNIKLKPYISRMDGSTKGDWDVGITIDILDSAEEVDKIILLSGDGDFDLLVQKVIDKYGCIVEIYGVKSLTSDSLIESASKFFPISKDFLL